MEAYLNDKTKPMMQLNCKSQEELGDARRYRFLAVHGLHLYFIDGLVVGYPSLDEGEQDDWEYQNKEKGHCLIGVIFEHKSTIKIKPK